MIAIIRHVLLAGAAESPVSARMLPHVDPSQIHPLVAPRLTPEMRSVAARKSRAQKIP